MKYKYTHNIFADNDIQLPDGCIIIKVMYIDIDNVTIDYLEPIIEKNTTECCDRCGKAIQRPKVCINGKIYDLCVECEKIIEKQNADKRI